MQSGKGPGTNKVLKLPADKHIMFVSIRAQDSVSSERPELFYSDPKSIVV